MGAYVVRKLLYNVPVFLGIVLLVMLALRSRDPVWMFLGKHATQEEYERVRKEVGLDQDIHVQYFRFLRSFDLDVYSWDKKGKKVGEMIAEAIPPSLAITLPALVLTAVVSILIALLCAYRRGKRLDKTLVTLAVLGMSISFLVYIVLGQYFGAYRLNEWLGREVFAIAGYETGEPRWWLHYCLLPVLISTIVAMGYDTRFYRAVLVEETTRDYVRTARAKGLPERTVMLKHVLKNASISVITHIMITLPFLVMGSILLEVYFNIPGMGRALITAINAKDFPVIQAFTALFAVLFIVSNVLTDVLYALADPRVRLQ